MNTGRLYGVGVGPGDPDLMTVKARRLVASGSVLAYFAAVGRPGNAWTTVQAVLAETDASGSPTVLRLEYPVTTEAVTDYETQMVAFYQRAAAEVAAHLDAGADVVVVCEGDPLFYGSYMYVHEYLAGRYPTTVVPGVTAFSAAAAAAGAPLVSLNERLVVISGVDGVEEIAAALSGAEAAVIMKVGRNLARVRDAVRRAGRSGDALYVERVSDSTERILPLDATEEISAPYFSLVLVPGRGVAQRLESPS